MLEGVRDHSWIRRLLVRAINLPLKKAITTSRGTVTSASLVLVDLLTSNGVTGSAYVTVYRPSALNALAALIIGFRPLVEGQPLIPERVSQQLADEFRLDGQTGLIGSAISAVDMAAWDALARERAIPLAQLLGGDVSTPIPAYASLVGWTATDLVLAAEAAVRCGFRAVKAKIGHPTLKEDLQVVKELRAVAGGQLAVMVDYNQLLSVDDAITRCSALSDAGVTWIEEPTRHDDHVGNSQIAAATAAPIQLGENIWSLEGVSDAIATNASDLLMLDAMRIGGVTGWMNATRKAKSAGLQISSHIFIEYSSHLLAATPTRHFIEWLDRAGDVMLQGMPRLDSGSVRPLDQPGTGIIWDEDAIRYFSVS